MEPEEIKELLQKQNELLQRQNKILEEGFFALLCTTRPFPKDVVDRFFKSLEK